MKDNTTEGLIVDAIFDKIPLASRSKFMRPTFTFAEMADAMNTVKTVTGNEMPNDIILFNIIKTLGMEHID